MAEVIAETVDQALESHRVTVSRMARLPKRLRQVRSSSPTLPPGPIDSWADELVGSPVRLVDGARLLSERFGEAR
jgi:hypothetical protein